MKTRALDSIPLWPRVINNFPCRETQHSILESRGDVPMFFEGHQKNMLSKGSSCMSRKQECRVSGLSQATELQVCSMTSVPMLRSQGLLCLGRMNEDMAMCVWRHGGGCPCTSLCVSYVSLWISVCLCACMCVYVCACVCALGKRETVRAVKGGKTNGPVL